MNNSSLKRTKTAKKHIAYSFVIKGIGIASNFLVVPIIISIIGTEQFGIWLTITSILAWLALSDVGLGQGLRNLFANAIAIGNDREAKEYVSTSYILISLIMTIVSLIGIIIVQFINWREVFNTELDIENELKTIVSLSIILFSYRFVFKLIGQILLADQKPAISNAFIPLSQVIILLLVYILNSFGIDISFLLVTVIYSAVPLVLYIGANFFFFRNRYRLYKPEIQYFRKVHIRKIVHLGLQFFIIQISVVLLVSSQNFIIAHYFSPSDVTTYNIGFKIFGLFQTVFLIVLSPFWSSVTEAYANNDNNWISHTLKKLFYIGLIFSTMIVFTFIYFDNIVNFWVGKQGIVVSRNLAFALMVYFVVFVFFSPFPQLLNGLSKLRLTSIIVLLDLILYIPLVSLLIGFFKLGIESVIWAQLVIEIPLRISQPIQSFLLLKNKATGIWNM